jgi:hypothetical protein
MLMPFEEYSFFFIEGVISPPKKLVLSSFKDDCSSEKSVNPK